MRWTGLLIVCLALAAPLYGFVLEAGQRDPVAVMSQYLGAAALIAMGISQLLATRWRGIEAVFGGLDRIYVLHKWLGIGAMLAILLHDTIDADIDGLGRETVLTELGETLGEFSLYGLLILVTLTVATFVPYHLWRYSHKFIGGFFAISALHYILILKPFDLVDPLGLYVLAFCLLGIAAYLYTLLPYGLLKRRSAYRVADLQETGDALAITLVPQDRGLRHRAGQFAFLSFEAPGLGEVHPFTISKAPGDDRALRVSVKRLGDYTGRLRTALQAGATAQISGPHGHFLPSRSGGEEVWVAAGIGITPFLAWAQALNDTAGPVHLFYCVRSREQAAHLDELQALAGAKPNLLLTIIESRKDGRLTADRIAAAVTGPLATIRVAFCGPRRMREDLRRDLAAKGLPASRFLFEEFEIRTGIGLRRAAEWVLAKL